MTRTAVVARFRLAADDPDHTARLDAVRQACADVAARVYVFPSLTFGQEGRAA